ncbi:MAG: hypothetical protein LC118_08615 [Dehalococcoidia bacterium]|nr:hypothetical protein [Dehalococcoidia bacterium]
MDIYCPVCGEPWEMDSLHDVPGTNYATARKRFAREGCALFETSHNDPPDSETAVRSGVCFELLGDDIDGIASLMEE